VWDFCLPRPWENRLPWPWEFRLSFPLGHIAVSRAFGALRVVVPKRELEKDGILMRTIALTGAS